MEKDNPHPLYPLSNILQLTWWCEMICEGRQKKNPSCFNEAFKTQIFSTAREQQPAQAGATYITER